MAKKISSWDKAFTQGYICALTTMIRSHGLETPIVDTWRCNKLTKAELILYKIDPTDIEVLEEHWEELNR